MASAAAKHLKAAASGFRNDFETDPDPELAQYRDMNRAAFLAAHPELRFVAVAALVFSPQNKHKPGRGEATTEGRGGQQLDEKEEEEEEEEEDRLLLMQRAASDSLPLLWEVPGGALDPEDPTVLHGAARELWEEAGLATKKVVRRVGPKFIAFFIRAGEPCACLSFEVEVDVDHIPGSPERGKEEEGEEAAADAWRYHASAPGGPRPRVTLNPHEHQRYVWATERECRDRKIELVVPGATGEGGGEKREIVHLKFTSPQRLSIIMEGFSLRKEQRRGKGLNAWALIVTGENQ